MVPMNVDETIRVAAKLAIDEGDLEHARALLDLLKDERRPSPVPVLVARKSPCQRCHCGFALTGSPDRCTNELSMIRRVEIAKQAEKQLRKVPHHIKVNLMIWVAAVELDGVEEIRKVAGYHDEPLKGSRVGQRSIRLSRSYRAIYVTKKDTVEFVSVEEVSKHDY